jgi:hypothetical protein
VVSPVVAVKTSRTPCWNMAMLTMTHVAKIATITANSTLAAPDSRGRRSTPHRTSEVDLTHSYSARPALTLRMRTVGACSRSASHPQLTSMTIQGASEINPSPTLIPTRRRL